MSLAGSWRAELRKLLLVVAASAALGYASGYTLEFFAAGVAAIAASWLWQLWRVRRWLGDPDQAPPEASGIWGLIYDTIYGLQRENREARGRLQSTVDYLRSSFASMRDGVVILSQSGAIEWCNGAAGGLLGLQYPRDRGQPVLNLLRWPAFNEYFLRGEFQTPLQLPTSADAKQVLQIDITTFAGGDFLLFARDVTRVVQIEQMRRDFVGNVSHELRTPLTVFKGYLDTIRSAGDMVDPRLQRPLEQMEAQVQRMESLLSDLLWLSRIESVREERRSEPVDMAALLEELREEMRQTYPDRLLVLELKTRQPVTGDYPELRSAVSNLVINAIKYSAEDKPVVAIWEEDEHGAAGESGKRALLLRVQDQGIGIGEQHLPRLTERFYRVDDSRSATTGGTGLGLAIVKHVAASHRAELLVDSEPGRGSTFTLRFPR